MKHARNFHNVTDVWQLKIMNALVNKQQTSEGTLSDNAALLSMEILNSLLMRYKMVMSKRLVEQKPLLRQFLIEKNLNFLQEHSTKSIQELMQLVIFFDLPLNFLNEPLDLSNVNLVQFMFEIKKRQFAESPSAEFISQLWNLLKN